MAKKKMSLILQEKRNWTNVEDKLPDPLDPVVIRFTNENITYGEDEGAIYYAEDIKVAYLDNDGNWVIHPPYPKYDYSPLSNGDHLLENAFVTHWAPLEDGELEGWKTRFYPIGDIKHLKVEIDKEHEEDLYKACLLASNYVARSAKDFDKLDDTSKEKRMYNVLSDIQACIDVGGYIDNNEVVINN